MLFASVPDRKHVCCFSTARCFIRTNPVPIPKHHYGKRHIFAVNLHSRLLPVYSFKRNIVVFYLWNSMAVTVRTSME